MFMFMFMWAHMKNDSILVELIENGFVRFIGQVSGIFSMQILCEWACVSDTDICTRHFVAIIAVFSRKLSSIVYIFLENQNTTTL